MTDKLVSDRAVTGYMYYFFGIAGLYAVGGLAKLTGRGFKHIYERTTKTPADPFKGGF